MNRKLLVLLIFLAFSKITFGQGSAGKDFWVTFLEPDSLCFPPIRPPEYIPLWEDDTLELFLSSPYATPVFIEVGKENYAASGSESYFFDTIHLKPNLPFRYIMPPNLRLASHGFYSDYTLNNGVHIYSDSAITVSATARNGYSSRGSTGVIPSESIPYCPEYVVTTNMSDDFWDCYVPPNVILPNKSPEFAIVGIAERSIIEIIPTGISTTRRSKIGVPFEIVLKKGETFGYVSNNNDLSGSIIRSRSANSKFAVFAGNRRTHSSQLNSSNTLCKSSSSSLDHTYEQIFPTVTWANTYTALPLKNNLGGYYIKVAAAEDYTRVSIDGNYLTTLQQGEFLTYNVSRDTVTKITGNKRIEVTQFALGTGCNQHPAPKINMGDVSQIQLIPDLQTATSAAVNWVFKDNWWGHTNALRAQENYINILLKTADTSQFRINGEAVANNLWRSGSKIGGYSYAQITIDTMVYNLKGNKGFIAYAYGYGLKEGYAYAASANFKTLQNNFFLDHQCLYDSTTITAIKNDSFSNYSWNTGNYTGIKYGNKVTLMYKDTGWYRVAMYCRHVRTNALDSIVKRIYIDDAKSRGNLLINDTIICGKVEFNVFSKNFNNEYDYLWNDGHPNYYREIGNPGQYWVKVTERNGCSFVDTLNVVQYQNPVASFSQSDSLFCANKIKPITFTNNTSSVDTVIFAEWDFGDKVILDTNRIVNHTYKNPDLYMVLLKVRTDKGCSDDTFQLIMIKKAPHASFTMSASDSCFSSNLVSFANTTVIDSSIHMRYKWYFSDSFVMSNTDPAGPRAFTRPGDNYALLIYENWNGCIDTMKKAITIYPAPEPSFKFQNNFSCQNDSIRVINTTTSDYKPILSEWDFGDNQTDTAFNPKHFYNQTGTYNVKLKASIPQGCWDTVSNSITIYGAPKADIKVDKDIQCLSSNRFTCINTSTTDTGGFILRKWTYSDGTGEQDKDTVVKTFGTAGNQTVKLKVTGIFGCSDSITKILHVKSAPVVRFTTNQASQCFTEHSYAFTYVPQSVNDSIKNITWYFHNDSIKKLATISNIKFPHVRSYPVKLKLTSIFGCDGEVINTVNINPNPIANFKVPKPLQCLNGNMFTPVHYSTITKGTIKSYNWNFGDLSFSLDEYPGAKTYSKSGSYKILLTNTSDSGCTDTVSTIVQIRASADININVVEEACLNDSSTLDGSALIADGFIRKYRWNYGDNSVSDSMVNPATVHLYKAVGKYSVTLTTISNYNCVDSKTETNWVTVNPLPNAAFKHEITDGKNHNSLVAFSDLTKPKPFSLRWDFGQYGTSRKSDTTISILDTTTIRTKLYVTDSKGCTGMIEKNIFASPPGRLYFPGAFTPNGDGINEWYGPQGIQYATGYKFTIYNRWGQIMFQSEKLGETWNGEYMGKLCPNGVYIYKLELHDFFDQYQDYEGSFLLIW